MCIDDECTNIPVYSDVHVPLISCNQSLELPGNGTVNGFLESIGGTAGSIGIGFIINQLGIGVCYSNLTYIVIEVNIYQHYRASLNVVKNFSKFSVRTVYLLDSLVPIPYLDV